MEEKERQQFRREGKNRKTAEVNRRENERKDGSKKYRGTSLKRKKEIGIKLERSIGR